MRQDPTPEEELKNAALFLCLAERIARNRAIGDRWKVQKCTFLVAQDQFEKKVKAFNLTFFRYDQGPFSKQLYGVLDMLKRARLLEAWGLDYHFTEEGAAFVSEFCADVYSDPKNQGFQKKCLEIGQKCGDMTGKAVKDYVYNLEIAPIGGHKQLVKDIPVGVNFTHVLDPGEADQEVVIPQGWLETLAILTSPENRRGMEEAKSDLANGRVSPRPARPRRHGWRPRRLSREMT